MCLTQADCPANERANLCTTASLKYCPGSVVAQCCQSGNRSRILESAQRLWMTSDTNIDMCGGATSLCGLKIGYERSEDDNGRSDNVIKD